MYRVCRSETKSSTSFSTDPRKFIPPSINEKVDAYHKLVILHNCNQPLAICSDSDDYTSRILHPCHNPAVERHIKMVTEPSELISGYEIRIETICHKIRSTELVKKCNTESHFES